MPVRHAIAPCLGGVVVAVVLIAVAGVSAAKVTTALLLLACPLVMFVMMGFMGTGHPARSDEHQQ